MNKTVNFQDGNGPVPAHQHANGGGWVADTAKVEPTAYVGPDARVYGNACVSGGSHSVTPLCITGLLPWTITQRDATSIQVGCQVVTKDNLKELAQTESLDLDRCKIIWDFVMEMQSKNESNN